jgi:hypothetical protein
MEQDRDAQIAGEDAEDTALLKKMAAKARDYIQSFDWCEPIRKSSPAFGVGGVVALFCFEFTEAIGGTDDKLWVVVGDVPSAYLVYEGNEDPAVALEQYCGLMEEWASAVRQGSSIDDCFPVDVPATQGNAEDLLSRIAFLRSEVVPLARP